MGRCLNSTCGNIPIRSRVFVRRLIPKWGLVPFLLIGLDRFFNTVVGVSEILGWIPYPT